MDEKKYKRLTERRETPLVMSMWAGTSQELRVYNRLAELEDKIENGTLIELPCKVGDTVYQTDGVRIYQGKIGEITLTKEHTIFTADIVCFDERAIGLGIFLTKAEAEKKLEELKNGR